MQMGLLYLQKREYFTYNGKANSWNLGMIFNTLPSQWFTSELMFTTLRLLLRNKATTGTV